MESSLCEKPERHASRRLSDHLTFEGQKHCSAKASVEGRNGRDGAPTEPCRRLCLAMAARCCVSSHFRLDEL